MGCGVSQCSSSAEEIVARLVSLRARRRTDLYRLILNTLLAVAHTASTTHADSYGPAVITTDRRPFDPDGELCAVLVISMQCVLHAAPPNQYQPRGRASLLSRMAPALQHIPFEFTPALLQEALVGLDYPYGVGVDVVQALFPLCDCVAEDGAATFHPA